MRWLSPALEETLEEMGNEFEHVDKFGFVNTYYIPSE